MIDFFELLSSPQIIWLSASSYALGSIPFGYFLVRWFTGKDLRKIGSRNIGATNVARTSGKILGLATLILDSGKGFLPVALGISFDYPMEILAFIGLMAVLGHCFPLWFRLQGGKGVATGFGAILGFSPTVALVGATVFLVVALSSKKVSLGAVLGALGILIAGFFVLASIVVNVILAIIVLIVISRHSENIKRLFSSDEGAL